MRVCAYDLAGWMCQNLITGNDGNFQKGMLAVTYYKRSANMSKQSTKSAIFWTNLQKTIEIRRDEKETLGYSQLGTGPELSVEAQKKKRKEKVHKHGLM